MKKSILKNSMFNMAYKLLNVLFPMITAVYVARVLMPEGVGKVGYAQNIMSYFAVIASLGIPTYGAREIARIIHDKEKTSQLFSELFLINIVSTLFCTIAYGGLICLVPAFRKQWLLYIAAGIQLFLNVFNVDWFYTGSEEYVYITVRSTVIKVLSIIGILLFVKEKNDYIIYALINSLAVSGNYLLNVYNLKGRVTLRLNNLQFKIHLKPVFVLLLTNLATDLYNQVDVTMIGSMCTETDVGYYTYAIKLVRIVTSISTAIAFTTLPRMSQYYIERKDAEFKCLFNKTLSAVLTIVLPCMLGLTLVSNSAICIVYGESFMPSAKILRAASPIFLIVAISYECGSIVLTATNNEKYLLAATFSGAATNIALNSLLIPKYAGTGAAIASVCAEAVVMFVHVFCSRKYINFAIKKGDVISVLIGLVSMSSVVLMIQNCFAWNELVVFCVSVCSGFVMYTAILIVLKNSIASTVWKRVVAVIKR